MLEICILRPTFLHKFTLIWYHVFAPCSQIIGFSPRFGCALCFTPYAYLSTNSTLVWYPEFLLEIDLIILLRKTGTGLNLKFIQISLHIDPGPCWTWYLMQNFVSVISWARDSSLKCNKPGFILNDRYDCRACLVRSITYVHEKLVWLLKIISISLSCVLSNKTMGPTFKKDRRAWCITPKFIIMTQHKNR
jgi:hypothetical protein